jgi:hypothetical protein
MKQTKQFVFISLSAILAISAITLPMQTAIAQAREPIDFIIRTVGAASQEGLVNVQISQNQIILNRVVEVSNVAIPITALVDVTAPVTVCAVSVLGETGDCRVINNIDKRGGQQVNVPLNVGSILQGQ